MGIAHLAVHLRYLPLDVGLPTTSPMEALSNTVKFRLFVIANV